MTEDKRTGACSTTRRRAAGMLVACGLMATVALPACGDDRSLSREIRLPQPADWTDHGAAIPAGPAGAWDTRLSGAVSPATVIKKEGTYFLYYIGADGDREEPPGDDGGPRHRALGVATSQDGIHFTKRDGNPVITFMPTPDGVNAQEEGVFSAAAAYDDGRITLYFGGLTMSGPTSVRIDVYETTSEDGFTFAEPTKVLDGEAPEVWGNERGNEVFPAGVFRHKETWNLYYLTKNRAPGFLDRLTGDRRDSWDYGLVSGKQSDRLDGSRQVLLQEDSTLGGEYRQLSAVKVGSDAYALFLSNYAPDESRTNIEARVVRANRPDAPGEPRVAYTFPDAAQAILFLDRAAGKWFMYYRQSGDPKEPIRVMTAPVTMGGD